MKKYKLMDKFNIHCYKHDGKIHRTWDEAFFLDETDDYLVFANNETMVTERDGRARITKEPAIMFFYKKNWFNVIVQFKERGIYFYCNLATPFIIDNHTIKYIDYDLDLRGFPDGGYKILDRLEYKYHKKQMGYSNEIDVILKYEMGILIKKLKNKENPFDDVIYKHYYNLYQSELKKISNQN